MKFTISKDRTRLTITADEIERKHLRELPADGHRDAICTDSAMVDWLENLVCNSELDWIRPEETGDLTSAPMLGIRDAADQVIERWAFMDYQVRSVLEDLRDKGEVIFIGGK